MMTLVASAGGSAVLTALLRTGGTDPGRHEGGPRPAHVSGGACPPTAGSSRELPQAWAAGAGPSDAPFTIDLDSTSETYGLAKECARMAIPASYPRAVAAGMGRARCARAAPSTPRSGAGRYGGASSHGPHTIASSDTASRSAGATKPALYNLSTPWDSSTPVPSMRRGCEPVGPTPPSE